MKRISTKYTRAPETGVDKAFRQPTRKPAHKDIQPASALSGFKKPLRAAKGLTFGRPRLSAVFLGAALCFLPEVSMTKQGATRLAPQVDLDHPANVTPILENGINPDRIERLVPTFALPQITQDLLNQRMAFPSGFNTSPVLSFRQTFDQAIYQWPSSKPKPLVIFDLGHNARYTENGCDIDPGAHYKGTNEIEIIDALAKHVLAALGPAKDYELVLTRQPDQELPGGCMDHRTSIISRLKVAQDAVKAGRETLFISLHVDASGWSDADHVAVYASSTHLGSQNLMGLMAQTMRDTSPSLKVDTRVDGRGLLIFDSGHQAATPVLIEFSDIRFGKKLKDQAFLTRKGQDIASGIRFAINSTVNAAERNEAMNGIRAFGAVRPSPM